MKLVRSILKSVTTIGVIGGSAIALFVYQQRHSTEALLVDEQKKTARLQEVVERLSVDRRVADVLVTGRSLDRGVPLTSVLFVEYDRAGNTLSPREFTVRGEQVYVDALTIRFNRGFITGGDALRGHSLALFQRIYGNAQSPDSAPPIDEPGKVPEIYRNADARLAEFELDLWTDFWRLFTDAEYRKLKGVDTAHGQSVYGPLKSDTLYSLSLDPTGGMSLKEAPVPAIYRAALKRSATTQSIQ